MMAAAIDNDADSRLYSTEKTADIDLVSLYLYLIEGGFMFLFNILLAVFIFSTRNLRTQKEFILFGINMVFDALYGLAYLISGVHKLVIFVYEEYVPLSSRWKCLLVPSSQMFALLIPGVGIISLITTVDRLISVSFPLQYLQFSPRYAIKMGLLAVFLSTPCYVVAMITSHNVRNVYNVSGLCSLQQSAITSVYVSFRVTRVVTSFVGISLYVPIYYKLYGIVTAASSSVSLSQKRKLRQITITVTLITVNEIFLFTVPDVCLIIDPSVNTFFYFVLNMNKGVVNIIIFLLTQKELRRAVLKKISSRFNTSVIVDLVPPRLSKTSARQ